jgi:hypothetical protein
MRFKAARRSSSGWRTKPSFMVDFRRLETRLRKLASVEPLESEEKEDSVELDRSNEEKSAGDLTRVGEGKPAATELRLSLDKAA